MQRLQSIKGMPDGLPTELASMQTLETVCRDWMAAYGYQEIRLPLLEKTELFDRTIGHVTDIVEKEMYTFEDRDGDSISLRPEGTAGCVRAAIQHGLLYKTQQRLWYLGPMFRHENPQKGRYRQFNQLGVEAFGYDDPSIDAEQLVMMYRCWQQLGIAKHLTLQLNNLGTSACRARYRETLVTYFNQHQDVLDEPHRERLAKNPLRLLDSKHPALQPLIAAAPKLLDTVDTAAQAHFQTVCRLLDQAGVPYDINPHLVRGLDYYTYTVYEWVTQALGAQGTVCAGGRYDGLVAQLGGDPTPAVGFACGLERIALLIDAVNPPPPLTVADVYLVLVGEGARAAGVLLADQLRLACPTLRIVTDLSGTGFKSQFKRADKSGAQWAVIVGEEEIQQARYTLKPLRSTTAQVQLTQDELVAVLLGSTEAITAKVGD